MEEYKKHIPAFSILILVPLYVLGVFVSDVFAPNDTPEETLTQQTILTFVGDMMFDRYVRERARVHGYDAVFMDAIPPTSLQGILVGNLEGPITSFAPVSDWRDSGSNHYRFTFATTVAQTLARANFDAVFIANNHIENFGAQGVAETKANLTQNNIGYFGTPDDPYTPWRNASSTPNVSLFAFSTWYANNIETITENIEKEGKDTFVVVYAHWGDEYEKKPNSGQREFAHRLIDAGADLVVGSHSHVVQTKEEYNGKWIYYSLGNFVFDQYFNASVRCGAVLTVSVNPDLSYAIEESFVELERDGTTKRSDCASFVEEETQ